MESLNKPRIDRVLVILKETTLRTIQTSSDREQRLKQLQQGVDNRASVEASDAEHEAAFLAVRLVLQRLGISFRSVYRQNLTRKHFSNIDLIISVGGDGTFLGATQMVSGVPVLGVNSAPSSSHGKFCICTGETFGAAFQDILDGKRQPLNLLRLQLSMDGTKLDGLVTNELLIHDESPAGSCRYYISHNGKQERQLSSGIYVSTPAGCTGSSRSAGGMIMPIAAQEYQYLVREPFMVDETWEMLQGRVSSGDEFVITSAMWDGYVYVDGKHSGLKYPFRRGSQLTVQPASLPLIAYVNADANDRYQRIVRSFDAA